jgi:IS30 family transposase
MIKNLLEDYLSPEQISGRLMLEKEVAISHETIYRYVWDDKIRGGILYKSLRTQGKRYRSRGNNKDSRGRIKNAVSEPTPNRWTENGEKQNTLST